MKWRQRAGKLFRAVHLADGAALENGNSLFEVVTPGGYSFPLHSNLRDRERQTESPGMIAGGNKKALLL